MPKIEQSPVIKTNLAVDELIRAELDGKLKAIAGYDEILWKIRAGYVGILYGSLALIIGTGEKLDLQTMINEPAQIIMLVLLIYGFSLSSYFVDKAYFAKKLKVIAIRDLLTKLTINNTVETMGDPSKLLAISGELEVAELPNQAREHFNRIFWKGIFRELIPIYATAPIIMSLIMLVIT